MRSGPARSTVIRTRTRRSLLHRRAVVVPVGMLARDLAVVRHQAVHGLGERYHLDRPLHLDPVPIEVVAEHDHSEARGRRRRFWAFMAVSRVVTTTRVLDHGGGHGES